MLDLDRGRPRMEHDDIIKAPDNLPQIKVQQEKPRLPSFMQRLNRVANTRKDLIDLTQTNSLLPEDA